MTGKHIEVQLTRAAQKDLKNLRHDMQGWLASSLGWRRTRRPGIGSRAVSPARPLSNSPCEAAARTAPSLYRASRCGLHRFHHRVAREHLPEGREPPRDAQAESGVTRPSPVERPRRTARTPIKPAIQRPLSDTRW